MYTLSDSTFKQLVLLADTLKNACIHKEVVKDNNFKRSTSYEVECVYSPHLYYHFQYENNYCHIQRINSGLYCIYCYGFTPHDDIGKTFSFSQETNELFRNSYGRFETLAEAKDAFCRIQHCYFNWKIQELPF